MKLTLDANHTYRLGTEKLLGCTETLKGVGLIDVQHYNEEGMLRGAWVHDQIERILTDQAIEDGVCDRCDGSGNTEHCGSDNMDVYLLPCDHCGGTGDLPTDPRDGYVRAGLKFIAEHDVEILHVEHILCDPLRKIAGKPDLIGQWRVNGQTRFVIPDWKTGGAERWHGYQLATYEHLARANGLVEGLCDRIVVHLRADGTYTTQPYKDRKDWKVAEAAFIIEQAKLAA
jgi:hypothetical protein